MEGTSENVEAKQPIHRDSQASQNSQTASDFIDQQLALEADAREILPYKFDKCTNLLGPLRQSVFACLTCSPPPASAAQVYTPAGVCYACSISCHGEHNLVELFTRRNFVCDCGTSRLPSTSSCAIRSDPNTGNRGVHSQEPGKGNHYNQNFQNHFCACGEEYDAEQEKGTMFQCLGLGSVETGGCGEDWYHPECLMGLERDWYKLSEPKSEEKKEQEEAEENSHPVPSGFPGEDDFEAMICYKCVESNPWIKKYAGTPGFLKPIFRQDSQTAADSNTVAEAAYSSSGQTSLKRKASDADLEGRPASPPKRVKDEDTPAPVASESGNDKTNSAPTTGTEAKPGHKHEALPAPPQGTFSLFLQSDFRDHICHCPACYPDLIPHPQLVEEEETYEPSLSSASRSEHNGAGGSGTSRAASLLDRGEAALSNMDRVRAIEGVMVYNHLRDKVKEFLKPFAETGQAVSAEDIKAYFEKLRGDEGGIQQASAKPVDGGTANGDGDTKGNGGAGGGTGSDGAGDSRREQSGY